MAVQHADIPVICSLCGTRMYAYATQVGKGIKCPDCHTINVIKEPLPQKPKATLAEEGPSYRLAVDPADIVRFACTSCHAGIRALSEHAGRKVRCPKCHAEQVVPVHDPPSAANSTPGPSTQSDYSPTKKQIADQIMARARQQVGEIAREEAPAVPTLPFISGVFSFPFYSSTFPIFFGMVVCIVAMSALLELTVDLLGTTSFAMIPGVFVGLVFGVVLAFFGLFFPPVLFSITELTAVGRDRVDIPGADFLDRLQIAFTLVVAVAFGAMPGLLVVSALGETKSWGMIPALVLVPVFLLSMLESASFFNFLSIRVRQSFTVTPESWLKFYGITIPLLVGAALLVRTVFSFAPGWPTTVVFAVTFPFVSLVYFRLVGRLAWAIGEAEYAVGNRRQREDG